MLPSLNILGNTNRIALEDKWENIINTSNLSFHLTGPICGSFLGRLR